MDQEATKIGMPLDEFIELSNQQPFELINGERRPKLPTVAGHSEVIRAFFRLFDRFASKIGSGEVYSETTFIRPDSADDEWVKGSRIPDVMFYTGTRLGDYKAAIPDWRTRPFALIPDLVVEVVSPNDKVSELDEKIDSYLSDSVRLIWMLDPQAQGCGLRT